MIYGPLFLPLQVQKTIRDTTEEYLSLVLSQTRLISIRESICVNFDLSACSNLNLLLTGIPDCFRIKC